MFRANSDGKLATVAVLQSSPSTLEAHSKPRKNSKPPPPSSLPKNLVAQWYPLLIFFLVLGSLRKVTNPKKGCPYRSMVTGLPRTMRAGPWQDFLTAHNPCDVSEDLSQPGAKGRFIRLAPKP